MSSNLKTLSRRSSSNGSVKFMNPMDIEEKASNQILSRDLFQRLLQEIPIPSYDSESAAAATRMIAELNLSPRQQQGCKCSKIDCLKLYCECFAKGKACNEYCSCVCCKNTEGNQGEIYHAKQIANFRHPGFFKGIPSLVPIRKCTCKKSLCRKKYCECYNAGLRCTEECQCINCHNEKPHTHDELSSMMEIEVNV